MEGKLLSARTGSSTHHHGRMFNTDYCLLNESVHPFTQHFILQQDIFTCRLLATYGDKRKNKTQCKCLRKVLGHQKPLEHQCTLAKIQTLIDAAVRHPNSPKGIPFS